MPGLKAKLNTKGVVYDTQPTLLQPYNVEVLFGREEDPFEDDHSKWKIVDIQVPLTDEEYSDLIKHFNDKHQSWQTSCYTYIFQNELANYQQWYDAHIHHMDPEEAVTETKVHDSMLVLRACSELYAPLERLINIRPQMDKDLIPDLLKALDDLRAGLVEKLPANLTEQLLKEIDQFTGEVERIQNTVPRDMVAIRQLFSLSREEAEDPSFIDYFFNPIPCLGYFLSQNLFELADVGRKELNRITDEASVRGKVYNRLRNQFDTPYSQNRLSDAKSQIERKRSAYGTEFNSNRAVIPVEMLDTLAPVNTDAQKRWTSLSRYLNRMDDREAIDTILRHVGKKAPYTEATSGIRSALAVAGATVIDLAPTIIRVAVSISAGIIGFVIRDMVFDPIAYSISRIDYWRKRAINAFSPDPTGDRRKALDLALELDDNERRETYQTITLLMDDFDAGLSTFHHMASWAGTAKTFRDRVYNQTDIKDLHKALGTHENYYQILLDRFSVRAFANFTRDTLNSIYNTVVSFPETMMNIGRHVYARQFSPNYRQNIMNKYTKKANDKLLEEFEKLFQAAEKNAQAAVDDGVAGKNGYPVRESVRDMETPHIESFVHFLQSIMVVLGDDIFDSVFRKSPGLATLSFMASCASFGILLAPHSVPALAAFSEGFAKATMGKEAGGSANMTAIMNNMFTAVLQYKALFVSLEGVKSIAKGDVELFKEIFKNPEEVTLAFCVASAAGYAMSYIPLLPRNITNIHFGLGGESYNLPNVYAEGMNLFIEEALECAQHGTFGATSIEFSFLSMKMGFLIQSMGAGLHHPSHDRSPLLDQMNKEYAAINPPKPMAYDELETQFTPLLIDYPDPSDKNLLLKQFHHSLILKAMFEEYKTAVHQAFANANPAYVAWSRWKHANPETRGAEPTKPGPIVAPPRVSITERKLKQIFNDYGVVEQNDRDYFINAFNEAQKSAKEYADISTKDILSGKNGIAGILQENKTPPETPRTKLINMFRFVRNLELSGTKIESSFEANAIYDMLHEAIEEYNKSLRDEGRDDLQFDGTEFKESFYNKFVYRGSNNFVRSLQLLLLLPLTVLWRLAQSGFAYALKRSGIPSHALRHKLDKSLEKDWFIVFQTAFMLGRLGQAAMRAVTYGIIRVAVLFFPVVLAAAITFLPMMINLALSAAAIAVGVAAMVPALVVSVFRFDLSAPRAVIKGTRDFIAATWNPTKNPFTYVMKPVWEFFVSPAIDFANWFRPYKNMTFPAFMRTSYASTVQKADTRNADLKKLADEGEEHLARNERILSGQEPKPINTPKKDIPKKEDPSASTTNGYLPTFNFKKPPENPLLVNYHRELRVVENGYNDISAQNPALVKDPQMRRVKKLLDDLAKYPPQTEDNLHSNIITLKYAQNDLHHVRSKLPPKPLTP